MSIDVDWTFVVQSRLRMPLREFFRKAKVKTYEEAVEALEGARLPVGTREEVARHLPSPPDTNPSPSNSDSSSDRSSVRSRKTIRGKSKKASSPRSAAEAAADAITKSKAVKSPQESPKKRTSRRRKST
tara:strand:+ start:1574 stop:1960 length:387 start_codon:yes stop_codon:yes gene_type:complete